VKTMDIHHDDRYCNMASIEFEKNSIASYDYFIQLEFVFKAK
jgi:hypothetical protein